MKKCGSPCSSGKPCKRKGNCPVHERKSNRSPDDELSALFSKVNLEETPLFRSGKATTVDDIIDQIAGLEVDEMAELEKKLGGVKLHSRLARGAGTKDNPLAAAAVRGDVKKVKKLIPKTNLRKIMEAYELVKDFGAKDVKLALEKALR